MKRGCGILLHVTSLPDPWGVGCFSDNCYKFIDFLSDSGVKYWQVLAFGPTGYGDSPYSPFSAFAGNPYFIDLSKYFRKDELEKYGFNTNSEKVDFANLFETKTKALKDYYSRGYDKEKLDDFIDENKFWVESYAAFMSIKESQGGKSWLDWESDLRNIKSPKVREFIKTHKSEVNFHIFVQMIFYEQWKGVRDYANARGIQIIGDIPFYPSMDSADTWAFTSQFDFTNGLPNAVAGVAPDYFNEDGQFWGNPLYNFKQMARDKFKWWGERLKHNSELFDVLRIDHFRAFDSYYRIPYGEKTARNGTWEKGPGLKFFAAMIPYVPDIQIVLEDLGDLIPSVLKLRDSTGYPGMRVMQFGFNGSPKNEHLPVNYPQKCIAYIGTHDNDTFMGYLGSISDQERQNIDQYLDSFRLRAKDVVRLGMENILSSPAEVVVLNMQDLLYQPTEFRMNTPGQPAGNWQYRIKANDLTPKLSAYLKMLIERSGR